MHEASGPRAARAPDPAPGTGRAARRRPRSAIADDRILIAGGAPADAAVAEWKRARCRHGADLRAVVADRPGDQARRVRRRRTPARPATSGLRSTRAVARVRAAGMKVTLTITGPGPLWSSSSPSRRRPAYRPRPSAYASFAGGRRVALRRRRRPLHAVERAEHRHLAVPAVALLARPLHAGLAAHLPRPRARRLSGRARRRPRRADRDRRALAARPAAAHRRAR